MVEDVDEAPELEDVDEAPEVEDVVELTDGGFIVGDLPRQSVSVERKGVAFMCVNTTECVVCIFKHKNCVVFINIHNTKNKSHLLNFSVLLKLMT